MMGANLNGVQCGVSDGHHYCVCVESFTVVVLFAVLMILILLYLFP
jgi:hypothetical protein